MFRLLMTELRYKKWGLLLSAFSSTMLARFALDAEMGFNVMLFWFALAIISITNNNFRETFRKELRMVQIMKQPISIAQIYRARLMLRLLPGIIVLIIFTLVLRYYEGGSLADAATRMLPTWFLMMSVSSLMAWTIDYATGGKRASIIATVIISLLAFPIFGMMLLSIINIWSGATDFLKQYNSLYLTLWILIFAAVHINEWYVFMRRTDYRV